MILGLAVELRDRVRLDDAFGPEVVGSCETDLGADLILEDGARNARLPHSHPRERLPGRLGRGISQAHGGAGDAQTAGASGEPIEGGGEFLACAQSIAQGVVHGAHALDEAAPASQVDTCRGGVGGGLRSDEGGEGALAGVSSQKGGAPALVASPEALDALGQTADDGQSERKRGGGAGEDEASVLADGGVDQREVTVVVTRSMPIAGGDVDAGGDPVPRGVALGTRPAEVGALGGQAGRWRGTAGAACRARGQDVGIH